MKIPICIMLATLGLLPSLAWAELVFENSTLSVKAGLTEEEKSGIFKFTNSGDAPVTITDIKTSCGCTTAALDKKEYLPGESGEIEAVLSIGQRVGRQVKHVRITTDDAEHPTYTLTFDVDIPQVINLKPRLLYWRKDSSAETKTVSVDIVYDEPVEVTGLENAPEGFDIKLETVEPGRKYVITATPESTAEVQRGVIKLKTESAMRSQRDFIVYLRVQ